MVLLSPVACAMLSFTVETLILIPGLPNDLASVILSLVPFSHQARLKSTSKSWHLFLSSKALFPLRRANLRPVSLSHLLCIFPHDPSLCPPYLFDPIHSAWARLPLMPCSAHRYGLSNFASVSLGSRIFILGGSYFDNRSFPADNPLASSSVYALDLSNSTWSLCSSMHTPRGSFACAADASRSAIIVAGGGSRHKLFGSGGTRTSAVEKYDAPRDRWIVEEDLPRYRAGCVGFMVGGDEFWVMGGYGDCRTISRVLPVDDYYSNGAVLELRNGKWREISDMWNPGERWKLGSVATIDGLDGARPGIFMLDRENILRYDADLSQWWKETELPRRTPPDKSCGFVALGGELHVMTVFPLSSVGGTSHRLKWKVTLLSQVYHPQERSWRFFVTKVPFKDSLDFRTAVMCTVQV